MPTINIALGNANPSEEVRKVLTPLTTKAPKFKVPEVASSLPKVDLPLNPDMLDTKIADEVERQKEEQTKIVRDLQDEETLAVQMGALFNQYTLAGNAAFHLGHMRPDLTRDENFDYYARREEFESGLQDWQIEEMRSEGGVLNEATAKAMRAKFEEMNIRDGITGRMNPVAALGIGVIAGIPDMLVGAPLFRAGQMLGKAAQSSKLVKGALGSYSPIANYAVEGASVGLGYGAALDVMGENYDIPAYLHMAAFGGLLNVPLSGAFRGFKEREPLDVDTAIAAAQAKGEDFVADNDLYDPKRMDVLLSYTHESPEAALKHMMDAANDYTAQAYVEAVKNTKSVDPEILRAEIARLHRRDMQEMFRPQDIVEPIVPKVDDTLIDKVVNGKASKEELTAFTEWAGTVDALPKLNEPYSTATVDRWAAGKATPEDIALIEEQVGDVSKLTPEEVSEMAVMLREEAPAPIVKEGTQTIVPDKGANRKARKAAKLELRRRLKEQQGVDDSARYEEAFRRMAERDGTVPPVAKEPPTTKPVMDKRKAKKLARKGQLPKEDPVAPKDDIDVMVEEVQVYSSTREAMLNDPEIKPLLEDDLITIDSDSTLLPEGIAGGVTYKGNIIDKLILKGNLQPKFAVAALWHEMAHVRIAKLAGSAKEYLNFVTFIQQSEELLAMVKVAREKWGEAYRKSFYDYAYFTTKDEALANQLADATLMEEIIADLYSSYRATGGLNSTYIKSRYGVEIPTGATSTFGKLIQKFTNWLTKTFPSVFKRNLTTDDIMKKLSELDKLGTDYEILQQVKEGSISTRKYDKPASSGVDVPTSESRGLGKAIDRERAVKQRVADVFYKQAEAYLAKIVIDKNKLIKTYKAVAPLMSAGMHLIQSNNPIARAFAAMCLEITTGAAGRNNFSASIVTAGKRTKYLQLAGKNVELLYDKWAAQQKGYTLVEGAWHGRLRKEWNELVTEARLWEAAKDRTKGEAPVFPQEVMEAAGLYKKAYQFMADEQRRFMTQGFARIPTTSDGYFPRSISSEWYASASEAERKLVAQVISDDLVTVWGADKKALADSVALRYMEQAADGLYGRGHAIHPAGLTNATLVEKLLAELDLPKATIKELLGSLGEGGARHTKKRIDLDLLKEYTMPDGTVKKLYQIFSTNQQELYQQYARRVSGEVGLRHNGIMGEKMLLQMLESMTTYAPKGQELTKAEVRAFEQVVAEFLGKPFGNQNLVMDNLRLVTSANLLGSAVFPQLSDMFQMMSHLGVANVFRVIPEFRKIREDIRMGRTVSSDAILRDVEAELGIFGYDYDVVTPYTDQSLSNINGAERAGRFTRIVRASSKVNQVWTFYHALHSAQQRLSAKLIISQTFQKLNRLTKEGKDTSHFFEDISGQLIGDMGFKSHPELLEALRKEMDKIATFNEDGHLVALDFRKATDHKLVTEFANVVNRGVGHVITDVRIGEGAVMYHSSLAKLLLQFRTVAVTATEKQLVRQHATLGNVRFMGTLAGALIFAVPLYMLKVQSRTIAMSQQEREEYLDKYMSDAAIAHGVMTYAIAAGIMPDLVDSAAYVSGSVLSHVETDDGSTVGAKINEALSVGSRNDITKAIPSLGYLGNTSKAIHQLMVNGDVAGVMKQMPAGAMWWSVPFLTGASNYAREDDE